MPTLVSTATAPMPERLSFNEAAAFLGISPKTLNAWNVKGRPHVPGYKIGRKRVYDRAELSAWMEKRRTQGGG